MNKAMINNMTDFEILSHITPSTDIERLLMDRLAKPMADPEEVESLHSNLNSLDDRVVMLDGNLESALELLEDVMEKAEEEGGLSDKYKKEVSKRIAELYP